MPNFIMAALKSQSPFVSGAQSVPDLPCSCERMAASGTPNVLAALGTLIGYVGTEVSIHDLFERLFWPQRYYNNFSPKNAWKFALFMPMGGPLHRASLQVLDKFYTKGLFQGENLGHMLGTEFFRDSNTRYNVHEPGCAIQHEFVRNGLWVRAMHEMPAPVKAKVVTTAPLEEGVPFIKKVRQRITVSHLQLKCSKNESEGVCVSHDVGPLQLHVWIAILTTELTGILNTILITVIWRSPSSVIWIIPLCLKLVSAAFALPREDLKLPEAPSSEKFGAEAPSKMYEIQSSGQGFQVIEGDDDSVFQFFRHYGHPIRCRYREILQISILIAFVALFPFGLFYSLLWMPTGMQYMWLSYQLYATVAIHVYHYSGGHIWGTTEERIYQAWACAEASNSDAIVCFGAEKAQIKATLTRTTHDNYSQGAAHVQHLLGRIQGPQIQRSHSSSSTSSSTLSINSSTALSPDHRKR